MHYYIKSLAIILMLANIRSLGMDTPSPEKTRSLFACLMSRHAEITPAKDKDPIECQICLDPLESEGQKIALTRLRCTSSRKLHSFHKPCLKTWREKNALCPSCNTPIIEANIYKKSLWDRYCCCLCCVD